MVSTGLNLLRSRKRQLGFALLATALALSGCAESTALPARNANEGNEQIRALTETLSVGSTGDGVAAVHHFLERTGYFPNPELEAQYPTWRPAVALLPERDDVFDQQTELAVRAFQHNANLEVTGKVDEETREVMLASRCAAPDGAHDHDHHHGDVDPETGLVEKYALFGGKWNKKALTWRLTNASACAAGTAGCPTTAQARTAIGAAFAQWSGATSLTFSELTSGTADIMLTYQNMANDPLGAGVLARAGGPSGGGDVSIDSTEPWSVNFLQRVILHELGHSLGIDHSSLNTAVMYPWITNNLSVTPEEHVPVSILYDEWTQVSGNATDIAVGANGAVWALSTTSAFGGYGIMQRVGNSWVGAQGVAKRIAVAPDGKPWGIGPDGKIYRLSTTSASTGTWQEMGGCATDIAIGADGSVWTLGCTAAFGGYGIQKWNGSAWVAASGVAVRIAVNQLGAPTVIGPTGAVARLSNNNPTTGTWDSSLPSIGQAPTAQTDIAIDGNGYTYIIGASNGVHVLNQNAQLTYAQDPSVIAAPGVNAWRSLGTGSSAAIAAGPLGVGNMGAWYVRNSDKAIFRQTK